MGTAFFSVSNTHFVHIFGPYIVLDNTLVQLGAGRGIQWFSLMFTFFCVSTIIEGQREAQGRINLLELFAQISLTAVWARQGGVGTTAKQTLDFLFSFWHLTLDSATRPRVPAQTHQFSALSWFHTASTWPSPHPSKAREHTVTRWTEEGLVLPTPQWFQR